MSPRRSHGEGPHTDLEVTTMQHQSIAPTAEHLASLAGLENGTGPEVMWGYTTPAACAAEKIRHYNAEAARPGSGWLTRLDLFVERVAGVAVENDPAALDAALVAVIREAAAWRAAIELDAAVTR